MSGAVSDLGECAIYACREGLSTDYCSDYCSNAELAESFEIKDEL